MNELRQNFKVDLRKAFVDQLIQLAEKDDKVVMVIPDVGFSFLERFQQKFPNRYFNFGVTEQSCVIIAAGMALQGLKPYVYSMINFVAFRPFEMVRNAISQHHANVKLLGVSGSAKYKFLGFSHNLLFEDEDTYILKPYIDCFTPKDEIDVKGIIKTTYESEKAAYIRL